MTVLESWYRKYADLNPAHQPKNKGAEKSLLPYFHLPNFT